MNRLESLEGRTLLSAAGDLDATFGPDQTGKVVQPLFGGSYDYAGAIAVQRDGKVLVAGSGANVTVVRYNPDGSLDQTFGAEHDGRAVAPIEGGGFTTSAVRVMRDGRIIVGQTYGSGFVLVRFNPDGLPDRSFGGGSGFVREASTNDYVTNLNDLVIRPDGRILTGGLRIDDGGAGAGFYFVQFNVDGSHDASFGPSGDGRLKLTGRGLDEIDCLRLLKDGRVLAAGRSRRDFALARITADGKADEAFGQGGFVYTDFGSRIEVARGIAVLDDKRIVLAGESGGDVVLARYFRNGLLDHTFGTGGKVRYDLGSPVDRANDLVVQADGKLIAVGETRVNDNGALAVAAARFSAHGAIDRSYADNGVSRLRFTQGSDAGVAGALGRDGRLVLAGVNPFDFRPSVPDPDFEVARLNLDGVADATFGPAHDGKVRTPLFGPTTFRVADAVRLADGKILTVGRFDDIERRPFHVTRFNADGSIDKTFGFRGTLLVDLPGGVNVGPNESALVALPGGNFAVGVISNPLIGEPGSSRLVLMQFDAQGRVDTTFADEGVATIDLGVLPLLFGESDSRLPLVRDSAGRFVVAVRRPSGYVLTRLSANGRLDTSFGADGFAAVSPGPAAGTGVIFNVVAIALDSLGRVIVAGGEREGNDPALISHGLVARFTPDGKPDTTFSPGGPDGSALVRLTFGHGLFSEEIRSLLVQRDGRIVIAGVRPRGTQNVYYDAVLVRLTKSGDLDRSFGIGGMTIAGDGRGYTDLAEAPDGKIIALSPPTLLKIARFNADGLPDTTFGDQGVTTTEFSPESEGSNGMQTRILFQPDGRIVVVGQGREDVLLARYLAGPSHSGGVEMAVRDGILRITGTAGDDLIRLQLSDGDITVSGNLLRIPVESFSRIEIDALGGNDTLDASASPVPVILNGGEGNDILLGGAYADLLSGNAGNDTLFGGRGNDTLHGNDGNDYLSGGPGADQVFGDSGNDQIFALDLAIDTIDGGTGFDRAKGDAADLLSHVEALLA